MSTANEAKASTSNKENQTGSKRKALGETSAPAPKSISNCELVFSSKKAKVTVGAERINLMVCDENEVSNLTAPSPLSEKKELTDSRTSVAKCNPEKTSESKSAQTLFSLVVAPQPKVETVHSMPVSLWCHEIEQVDDRHFFAPSSGCSTPPPQTADLFYARDPDFATSTVVEMYRHFQVAERVNRVDPNYLYRRYGTGSDRKRAMLADNIMNVCRTLGLLQPTLFLAVHIVDSFYSRASIERPQEESIRVVAFTSIMIAAKFEEGGRFPRGRFVDVFFSRLYTGEDSPGLLKAMLQCEPRMVLATSSAIGSPTILTFLNRYLLVQEVPGSVSASVTATARCICERSLLEYSMLKYLPSLVAATAVSMALSIHECAAWSSPLQQASGYAQSDLAQCAQELRDIFGFETLLRAREYALHLLQEAGARERTYGALARAVVSSRAACAHEMLYESYLLPVLEHFHWEALEMETLCSSRGGSGGSSASLLTAGDKHPSSNLFATPPLLSAGLSQSSSSSSSSFCGSVDTGVTTTCSDSSSHSGGGTMRLTDVIPQIDCPQILSVLDGAKNRFARTTYNRIVTCSYRF